MRINFADTFAQLYKVIPKLDGYITDVWAVCNGT